jgi:hypothetical protein
VETRDRYNKPVTHEDLEPEVERESAPESPSDRTEAERPAPELSLPVAQAWGGGGRSSAGIGIGRWASFGCLAVLIILVVVLVIGVGMTKRTAWMAVARVQQRLMQELPRDLPSGERLRTERNLQRFRARLEVEADPFPLIGGFLNQAQAFLEDDELSASEVTELNRFLESLLDGDRDLAVGD